MKFIQVGNDPKDLPRGMTADTRTRVFINTERVDLMTERKGTVSFYRVQVDRYGGTKAVLIASEPGGTAEFRIDALIQEPVVR